MVEKKEDLTKEFLMSFSQERKIKYNPKEKFIFNQFKTNVKKGNIFNFNKSIYSRVQNININDNINDSKKLNLKDFINNNSNLLIKSQKIEKPIKIKKEQNIINNKVLPALHSDKNNNINDSISTKKFIIKAKKDFFKVKKEKNTANKSYFSVDKVKIKKTSSKRNQSKEFELLKSGKNMQYISTLNSKINMKTSVNKSKMQKKYCPIISSSNNIKKRGYSSHSVNIYKKKKLKLKNKKKLFNNKSSFNILKSIDELKNDLTNKDNIHNIDNNVGCGEEKKNILSNRGKIYDYLITKYENHNPNTNNINVIENTEENIKAQNQKSVQMYFYVYHFFKSNNIYFFIPNSKYDQIKSKLLNNSSQTEKIDKAKNINSPNQINIITNSQKTIKNYEIIENFYLPQAFRPRMNKWGNMPECITDTCKNGGFALIKNFDNCNLIWRLVHPNKMKILIRNIHQNQKYNHFISTFHLGRKDNLYKHFKYYKRMFPEMFNYAPATYILPTDGPDFEFEYKKNKKALWIVKPVNLSRGRGIHLLRGESEFKSLYKRSTQLSLPQYLISRYIDKPHLLNNKKYDLRIYVLVASFTPLRIYLYNNGLVRFATEDYKKGDFENVYIHLTNYSINKNNLKYKCNNNIQKQQCEIFPREETETEAEGGMEGDIYNLEEGEENVDDNIPDDDDSNKWSLIEYRNHFKKLGENHIMDLIWSQIESIVTKTVISVSKEYYKNIFPSKINNSFELYGFDILIDANYKAWIVEVNVNPSLHCTSPLDLSIKTDLISDIFNVVGILPYNHNGNKSVYNYLMINNKKQKDENKSVINNYITPISKNTEKIERKKSNNKLLKTERDEFNSKMTIKSNILRNFEPDNLEKQLPEYDDEYYKKMIENFTEEKSRSHLTEFSLIFPLKNNIKTYGNILIKDNAINDYNIVLWQYILTHE